RLTANDGALSRTDSVQVTVLAPPPVDRRIALGSDDAEEDTGTFPNLASADLELVFDTSLQTVGLRFTNVTVPQGATVTNAYIQFEADEVQSEATHLTFKAQAADNATTFTSGSGNISTRPRTTASASWSPVAWTVIGEQGANQRTPDLKAVIQEVVNRPGWASGNALAIIITGTGHRTARSFDGLAAGAALLHIEVGGPPPPNVPPVVDAGPNQTITLPAGAALDGTVTDDGLPSPPGATTTTWSKGSGPGSVTFQNAGAVDTQASFTVAGTYVLRLTASDGALTAYDSVQVTVQPVPNAPPLVDAGPNQTITLPAAAALDGTVSDDGLPSPPGATTTTWSVGGGPGSVTFQNAGAVDTQASFTVAGTYVLRLTANDGALSRTDSVQVTVQPDPNVAPVVNAGPDQTVVLPAGAALDGTVSDDGLPTPPALTATWSVVSGPGPVTFQNASQVDTQASFTTAGVYVLRLTVSDGRLSTSDQVQITAQAVAAPLERRVVASTDDAEESASGVMNLSSTNLELVFNASNQTVGLRFTTLAIPAGATITRAYVQFTARKVDHGSSSLTIRGQAADNPGTFNGTNLNLSGRPRTTASVAWSPPDWTKIGDALAEERTPELKSVIQEIVSRPGWASGNALVIVITGSGTRTASPYDGASAEAPLLHVEYATAGAPLMSLRTAPLVESVTDGPRAETALHGVGPNPAGSELWVEFSLADRGPACVELMDVAGRRVAVREVGSFGPGRHRLAVRDDLPTGVYLVRLVQGARTRVAKVAVLR
ncbi:MAG: PKD domain-containing protein, partial [Candidatus Eiseniibacteriota bacterium]